MKKGLYKVMVIIDTEEDAQDEVKNIIEGGATAQEATATELSFKEDSLGADLAYTIMKE